ncbi:Appr-1-p processing domain protein OS=Treponema primitia (strain ATCC BAA-887 / DSM 12427 / ZAS-2) GN=TREPR_0622 PE=4 SV=1: Macro [Gemmataceae bacterium]|nr:Appr-1-p processing domain protein OS=Treponema primitia (strain ATCC BAA-887 / DSM 12427 / ZAS-2) GN=TREPR_0622 PE=4 SV=1: Macro [Gemmataceae bacterium]VTT96458.1 Appr-1-p processing domain protein OS=Treponema primitia (strain ATCC BAA-887 / DSM 12427 / ZAS-2) GN=TREPR_0622 PE=4 SV=1: Macro [Gemmataceae bacterium]
MAGVTYHLRDFGREMTTAWQRHFAGVEEVVPGTGDIFGVPVDAVISPANCFGFMDGGIDRVYSNRFGWHVQDQLREIIRRDWDGELPVGLALVLDTGSDEVPFLIAAPTLRAPVSVANTLNAYLAFRAALRAVRQQNERAPGSIRSVACPGLGTGTGEIPEGICARQMRAAWDEVEGGRPFAPIGVNDALTQHYRLLREE